MPVARPTRYSAVTLKIIHLLWHLSISMRGDQRPKYCNISRCIYIFAETSAIPRSCYFFFEHLKYVLRKHKPIVIFVPLDSVTSTCPPPDPENCLKLSRANRLWVIFVKVSPLLTLVFGRIILFALSGLTMKFHCRLDDQGSNWAGTAATAWLERRGPRSKEKEWLHLWSG